MLCARSGELDVIRSAVELMQQGPIEPEAPCRGPGPVRASRRRTYRSGAAAGRYCSLESGSLTRPPVPWGAMERIARVVTRKPLRASAGDAAYWRRQPRARRLAMIEELRRRQHGWDDETRPELQRVLRVVNAHEARFLVVNGYAVGLHGHPRYTADIDVWLLVDLANANAVLRALEDFGFGGLDLNRLAMNRSG
jgi:hypothetical protein